MALGASARVLTVQDFVRRTTPAGSWHAVQAVFPLDIARAIVAAVIVVEVGAWQVSQPRVGCSVVRFALLAA